MIEGQTIGKGNSKTKIPAIKHQQLSNLNPLKSFNKTRIIMVFERAPNRQQDQSDHHSIP